MANTRRKAEQQKNWKLFFSDPSSRITILHLGFHDALINMLLISCMVEFWVCFGCLTKCRTILFLTTFSVHFVLSFLKMFHYLICSGGLYGEKQSCQLIRVILWRPMIRNIKYWSHSFTISYVMASRAACRLLIIFKEEDYNGCCYQ